MTIRRFDHDEPGYEQWKRNYPNGYILNTHRPANYDYAKIHRVGCWSLERHAGSEQPDPFTGQTQIKICSDNRQELVDWTTQNRRRVTRNRFCAHCNP